MEESNSSIILSQKGGDHRAKRTKCLAPDPMAFDGLFDTLWENNISQI